MLPYIVADIGGTNARFGLVETLELNGQPSVERIEILPGQDFPSFADALAHYISGLGGVRPTAACIAIASPIEGDWIHMTHLPWAFSIKETKQKFGFKIFDVMNDFKAVAMGVSVTTSNDLTLVKDGVAVPKENKAIVGPGTGLGVSALTFCEASGRWLSISGLGGHVNMPAVSDFEVAVIQAAMKKLPHVSAELLISGTGLPYLHEAVCDVIGEVPCAKTASDITHYALNEKKLTCIKTLDVFSAFLGIIAGNLALTFGARGGVYIAGGIVPRFIEVLKNSDFIKRYENKGVMSDYVKKIPVYVLTNPHNGLVGAAAWLAHVIDSNDHSLLEP